MRNTKAFAAAAAALLLCAALGYARQGEGGKGGAELGETLKRLEKTLSRHGSLASRGFIMRFDAKDFRGCEIVYELTPQVSPGHTGFVPFIERTTLDLSALDPARVSVREGGRGVASVSLTTRGDRPLIKYQFGREPHHFGKAAHVSSRLIRLSDRKAAEDAREALVRAAELCAH